VAPAQPGDLAVPQAAIALSAYCTRRRFNAREN
jgi:hypothetical protein